MSKINEYPQAVTINNNDLFVIDQESGGDHATKSASVSQIADKATSGVQTQIGDLSTLTTSDTSSLVGAVNEVAGAVGNCVTTTDYENITQPTINTSAGLSGNVYCKQIGHLVIVWGTIATTNALSSGTNILSGLPNKTQHSANVVTRGFDNSSGSPADDIVLYQPTTVLQLSGTAGANKSYTIYYMYYA